MCNKLQISFEAKFAVASFFQQLTAMHVPNHMGRALIFGTITFNKFFKKSKLHTVTKKTHLYSSEKGPTDLRCLFVTGAEHSRIMSKDNLRFKFKFRR